MNGQGQRFELLPRVVFVPLGYLYSSHVRARVRLTNALKLDVPHINSRGTELTCHISFNADLLNQLTYVSASKNDISLLGHLVLNSQLDGYLPRHYMIYIVNEAKGFHFDL